MNEIFAAEPTCFRNVTELRSLLKQFGPYTGRYLVLIQKRNDLILFDKT